MKILHISDLHFKDENKNSIEMIVNALIKDINENIKENIDFIVFSGDLTYSADIMENIIEAYENSIGKIASELNIPNERIILCQGNHDISRKIVLENQGIIEKGIASQIIDRDSLNNLLSNGEKDKYSDLLFKRTHNFYSAIEKVKPVKEFYKDPLLEVNIFEYEEKTYGFCSFNSSWRSTGSGEGDRKKLLVGEYNVRRALAKIPDVDIKIAILHHPFDWLAEFDRRIIEPLMLGNFDLILQGHIHSSFPEGKVNSLGNCIIAQCGCLYQSSDYVNFYQIIDIDLNMEQIEFSMRTWFDSPRFVFDKAVNISSDGQIKFPFTPLSGQNKNPTGKIAVMAREVSRYKANEHISFEENDMQDFDKTFICPPLSPAEGDKE
ncbi:hypothetical protein NBRC3280_3297 [Acetobacter pasteurianus NBRC 3280]|uniref:Calcineurin-like phosphoesterase domain-containing protein n=1 Tax=Acetobacter pasteurianus NBRC 3278 TaxID=1226660 RepID=A0A401WZP9_ACEPA|nr:metallophosphoesterase [Acetobacter pasteurianus]GCD57603.1 hypothetical protein NBRC3277_0178 [Acetobacter pasteurianus NBRC 3277]GCD61073.1 hypothetical protein NBRC3278_0166 [Acetobacter pasteurianus NBRC 3278]GCD70662.1 hypothetical protein NBRC3280_3297 [Acetobacter pasteurianus NBRC 3280]